MPHELDLLLAVEVAPERGVLVALDVEELAVVQRATVLVAGRVGRAYLGGMANVKVRLRLRGERDAVDTESVWAEDIGPADQATAARRVRLANVPCFFVKPTFGDTIVAAPDAGDGALTWEAHESEAPDIAEDGGRWVMIVDYDLAHGVAAAAVGPLALRQQVRRQRREKQRADLAFGALVAAVREADVVVEGAWSLRGSEPGRAYLAAPASLDVAAVLARLREADPPLVLTLVHPDEGGEHAPPGAPMGGGGEAAPPGGEGDPPPA